MESLTMTPDVKPAKPFRYAIFDLDGVLVDTAEYHYLAWKKIADPGFSSQ